MKKIYSLFFALTICAMTAFAVEEATSAYNWSILSKGKFSVSSTKMVYLAKSNICYTPSTQKMEFLITPWLTVGAANANLEAGGTQKTDLFFWGADYADAPKLWSVDVDANKCGSGLKNGQSFHDGVNFTFIHYGSETEGVSDNYDWGTLYSISNQPKGTYYTMTASEWDYLIFKRANAGNLRGMAIVNGIPGLVILPDNWHTPFELSFRPFGTSQRQVYNYNQFTAEEWDMMDKAGAVFLPAAGERYMKTSSTGERKLVVEYSTYNGDGRYWTSTSANEDDTQRAMFFCCFGAGLYPDYDNLSIWKKQRNVGMAVRLAATEKINKSEATLVNKQTINLDLDANGQATWNGHTFTTPGTYYYTQLEADGHKDWLYTINVYPYTASYTVRLEYEIKDHSMPTNWPSERIAQYITPSQTNRRFVNHTISVPQGTTIRLDKKFTSDIFTYYGFSSTAGNHGTGTEVSTFELAQTDQVVTITVEPRSFRPEALCSSARYGSASYNCDNNPNMAMDEWPDIYNSDWGLAYLCTLNSNAYFYGWVPTALINQMDGDEQAALAVLKERLENSQSDTERAILQKFQQESFLIELDEVGTFIEMCSDGTTNKLSMTASMGKTAPSEGFDQIVNRQSSNRKFIKDGQLYIERNGKIYNALGAEIR